LQADRRAIVKRMQRYKSDCKAIAKRLHSRCKPIAKISQSDSIAVASRSQRYLKATSN
jgi:hypothetical protein